MLYVILAVFILVLLPHDARATDCKDSAVVVVASVFATLAVVFIVLGIAGFLIWKRRRDISRPVKLKNETSGSSPSSPGNGQYGYNNPAFDKDPETGDSGAPGYVPCKDQMSEKKKPKSMTSNEMATKTWSSLPGSDMPYGRSRKSSTGSLDGNNYPSEDSIAEVWLTSQDFIGLGFNIAGSMRDGIYVSQVHNRGPANESGQFKVGDRIMSVAISFENMVYEDALTILSYASPYPVKVTLQKQQHMPKHRRLSEVRTNLNHPLYRSQSVDALNVVPRESVPSFQAKRSASEMRHDRRDSPRTTRTSKLGSESDIIEESNSSSKDDVFLKNVAISKGNDFIQGKKSDNERLTFDREVSIPTETDLPLASVDLNIDDGKVDEKKESTNAPFTDAFQHLTEEDKLDVLRLTYDDPNQVVNKSFEGQQQVVEAEINHQVVNGDLKSAPVKPERKKKRSSSNSTPSQSDVDFSDSSLSSPRFVKDNSIDDETPSCPTEAPPPLPDEVFELSIAPPTEAPPSLPEHLDMPDILPPSVPPPPVPDNEPEASEEMIMPQKKERDVSVNSNSIVLETATPTKHDISDISIDRTVIGDTSFSDYSFTDDVDTTLVNSPAGQTDSSDEDAVNEEQISATQLKKGDILFNSSNVFVQSEVKAISNGIRERKDSSSSNSSKNENDNNNEKQIYKINSNVQESVQQSDDDFEKDLPSLDMNLNFDNFGSDSVLFKETFPSRHERESDGGMAYDISVTELESMEQKFRNDELAKNQNQSGKGGIAFDVREDLESGNTRTVNTNSVHRTLSCELQSSTDVFIAREISTHRPTSLKGDSKRADDEVVGMFDWSGKRLVRSGSFSEIPQGDSVKDWTDDKNLSEDDSLIEQHIEEDANSSVLKPLTRATQFQSNQTKENLSDSDSQCRSLSSSSSSRSTSPNHLENYHGTNGEDDGLGMSPDNSPIKITPTTDIKSDLTTIFSKYGDNDQALTVTLGTAEDEDC